MKEGKKVCCEKVGGGGGKGGSGGGREAGTDRERKSKTETNGPLGE